MIKRLSRELLRELADAPKKTALAWYNRLTPEEQKEADRLLAALKLKKEEKSNEKAEER